MTNKHVKLDLILQYGMICMAGGEISKCNVITMHHIIRRYDKGKTDINNGSLVAHKEHCALHILSDDKKTNEKTIQDQLRYWKETRDELSRLHFHIWIIQETERLGFEEVYTKDKLLMYRRK